MAGVRRRNFHSFLKCGEKKQRKPLWNPQQMQEHQISFFEFHQTIVDLQCCVTLGVHQNQRESVIYIYSYIHSFQILCPQRPLHRVLNRGLCDTQWILSSIQSSILYTAVHICHPSLPIYPSPFFLPVIMDCFLHLQLYLCFTEINFYPFFLRFHIMLTIHQQKNGIRCSTYIQWNITQPLKGTK